MEPQNVNVTAWENMKIFISSFVFIVITFTCVALDDHLLQTQNTFANKIVTIYYFKLKIFLALTDIFSSFSY